MKIFLSLFFLFISVGCSYKEGDFVAQDPKESIFYDFSQEAKDRALQKKYGIQWHDKI